MSEPTAAGSRWRRAIGLLSGALLLAACSTTPSRPATVEPGSIIPVPAGAISLTPPSTTGALWVLSGTATTKDISLIDATSGRIDRTVGVSADTSDLAGSASAELALGIGAGSVGSVAVVDGATGRTIRTVPVADPVISASSSQDGTRTVALEAGENGRTVAVVDTGSGQISTIEPAPANARAVVATPDGTGCWVLLPDGKVAQIGLASRSAPITEFGTGQAAVAFALSPSGQTLYVLRSGERTANVAVVSVATESVQRVLPAPLGAVALVVAPDGRRLYVAATRARQSNIQVFAI